MTPGPPQRSLGHAFTSPLRYPGGKGSLANFMRLVVESNSLGKGHYAEPYAGGAAVAWSLLFGEYVRHVHVNDIDPAIHSFWTAVLEHTEELCRRVRDWKVSMTAWRRQRTILARPEDHSALDVGFAAFFLNRTNRSGILKGGVIGGLEQTGPWKLDARYNRADLIARIQKIARYRTRISLRRMDAASFLREVVPTLPLKTLLYLDPPYFVKGEGLYEHHYGEEDHRDIAKLVGGLGRDRFWIVSYDASPTILKLYGRFRHQQYDLAYSAQDRYAGSEVIFYSPGLKVPRVANPAKLTA